MPDHRRPILFALLISLSIAAAPVAAADRGPFLDRSAGSLPARDGAWEAPLPGHFRALEVDIAALASLLEKAPAEGSARGSAGTPPLLLTLPYPDGTDRLFSVRESPILEPGLAAKFPEIHTFVAQGIDDPTATARLSLTRLGFHAMVLSASGTVLVDPYRRGDARYVVSYRKEEARRAPGPPFHCDVVDSGPAPEIPEERRMPSQISLPATASGLKLRTYRLALAATGEYSTAVCAPNPAAVACAMTAMVVSVNRVDGIYEREVAIRMVLVANDDLIVYTNGATDPYTNSDGGTMLGQNQTNLDSVIGSANYDVGHVFSTGGGGIAALRVPCTGSKANGVTGLGNPVGDSFDIDYVAHEMGHQFGGNHTFNGTSGSCGGGNRAASAAYEPGSGSTIMAYAGICSPEDLQPHSDAIFHTKSFDEIVSFSTGTTGSSCAVITDTGNQPPTVDAGPAFTVPKETPFTLTGSASDPDGDALTYLWEELDLGTAAPPDDDVSSVRPIFRSFVPSPSPSRTLPRLTDVLGNSATFGESMPTRSRTMTFRLTARDNRAGGGGVNYASTTVTVAGAAGPFAVTQPNTALSWPGNSTQTVTWNVAGTDVAPVSCADVAIDLSTDGGATFPISLVASAPNDGSQAVALPDRQTTQARIRVSCVGNVFFDVSDVDFQITAASNPPVTGFYTVTPCRIVDTRNPNGPFGGPALAGGTVRTFSIAGVCGVPADASAVAVNATVVLSTAAGSLRLYPGGIPPPPISSISFGAGQARSNNGIVGLTGPIAGSLDVKTDLPAGSTAHFVLDVAGYFKE